MPTTQFQMVVEPQVQVRAEVELVVPLLFVPFSVPVITDVVVFSVVPLLPATLRVAPTTLLPSVAS
ncbi:hypothetical protein AMIS_6460 [Actinoplanes missouriensis 431]|uniref:Uncharacterized protein n=1 Tax=Actinoplanes missouriensis (strain ATCC 14538 / DSM 43046 / CBS 188.64 / JCM 3121 / NBRC 102363 / NCIMB 12654 / NRRL B-3342 / UNCC 431) TaxID=512565 RepID=I0GYM9_ACTM4|nr:hypothetical protein AMIS_6460 [Actinoplanes missouriensis 431]